MQAIDRLIRVGIVLTVIWFVGLGAWWVGSKLSSDAIGLALGVNFGTMASLPGAVLVLVARRREAERPPQQWQAQQPQPPVIVITGHTAPALPYERDESAIADAWGRPVKEQRRIGTQPERPAPVQSDTEGGWFDD